MNHDCNIRVGNLAFRYRAAAIITEGENVLLIKSKVGEYYYSVGGGVHIGETAEDAVKREVFEETGVQYEVDRLAFVHENFFVEESDIECPNHHEVAFYYLMKPRGSAALPLTETDTGEKLCWLPIDKLGEYTAYPEFLKDKLPLKESVEHIITREEWYNPMR